MAKKKKKSGSGDGYERIFDWSGGQNNAVNEALLNDNESVLLQNYSLDEKGTLFPRNGSRDRYDSDISSSPVAGMGRFYKSDGTSRLLIGLEDGKLYADSPHLASVYDTQAEFGNGSKFATVADSTGKLWPAVMQDGFESGLFDDWQTHDSGWTIDTAVYKTGAKSAKGTGTTQKLIRELGVDAGQLYVKLAVRFAENTQVHYPVMFKSPADTEIHALVADSDGNFKYHNGTALTALPTATSYAANTWYVVEVWVRGGTFWISIDGASKTTSGLTMKDTANNTQTQVSKFQVLNAGGTSATTYVDDVTISLLDPVFSRASTATKLDSSSVAVNAPRFEDIKKTYTEDTQTDFQQGTLTDVTATDDGSLELAKAGTDFIETATNTADFNGMHEDTEAADNAVKLVVNTAVDIMPTITGPSSPSPYVITCTSPLYGDANHAWHAFDDSDSTRFYTYQQSWPQFIQVDLGEGNAKVVRGYSIYMLWFCTTAPRTWTFLGSTNGTDWTTLDSREDIAFNNGDKLIFTFNNSTAYRYYKFIFTQGWSVSEFIIYEIEFYSNYVSSGTYTHPEQDISGVGTVGSATISFNKTTPANTTLTVEVRVYENPAFEAIGCVDGGGNSGWVFEEA